MFIVVNVFSWGSCFVVLLGKFWFRIFKKGEREVVYGILGDVC